MKITKKGVALAPGTVVALKSGEFFTVKAVFREPDGICYRVQFIESKEKPYVLIGEPRIMWHYELVGAEV